MDSFNTKLGRIEVAKEAIKQKRSAYSSEYDLYALNNGTKTKVATFTEFDDNTYSRYIAVKD